MDFEHRLEQAIARGKRVSDAQAQSHRQQTLSEEDYRRLHAQQRLALSERIEDCMRRLPQHFPGFRFETIVGEQGWGAAVRRDDITFARPGQRTDLFSRMEMTVRPFSSAHILELAAKGTIRNKEVFNRTQFQKLDEADAETFATLIDAWVLEYAELYAARS